MCGFIFWQGKEIQKESFLNHLNKIKHRGPDSSQVLNLKRAYLGFNRLSVMDLHSRADQPFKNGNTYLMCNGEIYNYQGLKESYADYNYQSQSDCEVVLAMYEKESFEKLCKQLDGEYAFVIYDENKDEVFAARDPMGIRPLFYGFTKKGNIVFASEVKAIQKEVKNIFPFPPGYYFVGGKFYSFHDHSKIQTNKSISYEKSLVGIKDLLEKAVIKRMKSDAKLGFLLSGGLDSSLVCSIAQKHSKEPIKTFAIGMSDDAIDLKYAREVADFIGSDHTEVIMDKDKVLTSLREVIYNLETWDITTVRASIGMTVVCHYIEKHFDIKALMTGEVSDELFGYKYTDFAPGPKEFQKEAQKRVRELYLYDVLRADRCISSASLEARVPFSDKDFVDFVMSIDPKIKMNSYGQGKYLLRAAFKGDYLPDSILFREKAAFSDAVGHSMVDYLKEYAESVYSDDEYMASKRKYNYRMPFTKESLLYRDIFEEFYPNKASLIPDYWMPNKRWENCNVKDPSARVLPNYGESAA